MKQRGYRRPTSGFLPVHMPRNTAAGVVLAALSAVLGFALIWYIWWLAALSALSLLAAAIAHTFDYHRDRHIPAERVDRTERLRTRLLAANGEQA
jgi:cytochrome o ubiquinol oxidase subunit 1